MKAYELHEYLLSLNGGWVNEKQTVDTFKSGDPQTEISGIAVGWMSYTWALQRALELGCNVFVTHEPTYYNHEDNDQRVFDLPGASEKRNFIEKQGLVIMRCHDVWDQFPQAGIPDSWGTLLDLGPKVDGEGYFRIYDVSGKTAGQVARQVAQRTRQFGQESVQLIGAPDQPVERAGIGTGAIINYFNMIKRFDVDLVVASDDGIWYWRDGAYAIDMGVPLVVVNHAVTEEAGLASLAEHLSRQFPDIPVHHISQRCMYQMISG